MSKKRKRLFILGAVLFSSINFLSAQITFQKTIGGTSGDYGLSGQQTTDGGYIIIAGSTVSFGAGNGDVYLIKTDANGDSLWTKIVGGTGIDVPYSVQQTTDGGYIIAAITDSFGAGNYDFYLIKTDSIGDTLWTKTFGGANDNEDYSVQQTSDGGYITAGRTVSFGAGNSDLYLIKTDTNGDSLWTKTFGGTGYDGAYSVQQTTDGGYIITGGIDIVGIGSDVCLIKTDSNGNPVWIKAFGGINDEAGYAVKQTTDEGYIICGTTYSFGAGYSDFYFIKTDSIGDLLWSKTFGGINSDVGYSVQQTADGGYIIIGYTNSFSGVSYYDVYLIKTDSNGDSLWTKTFGGIDYDAGSSIEQTTDGGYIITGNTVSFGAGLSDVYLIKTDSLGNSGCNEGNTTTIVTTPATQVTNPVTIVSSPFTIVTTPATIVGSGGIINTLCTTVGINETTTNNLFLISPNPSAGNFIISFEVMIMKGNVEILNILGANVFTENIFSESRKEINLKNIFSGIYFVKVYDGENYYCKKIIIE